MSFKDTKAIVIDGKQCPLETEQDFMRAAVKLSQAETIRFDGQVEDVVKLASLAKKAAPDFVRLRDRIANISGCSSQEAEGLALYAQATGKEAGEAAMLLEDPEISIGFEVKKHFIKSIDEVVEYLNELSEEGRMAAAKTIKAVIAADGEPTTDAEVELSPLVGIVAPLQQAPIGAPAADNIADAAYGASSMHSVLSLLTEQDMKDAAASGKKGTTVCLFAPQGSPFVTNKATAIQLIQGKNSVTGGVKAARTSMQEVILVIDEYTGKPVLKKKDDDKSSKNS